jgi:hypothetical protein
VAGTTPSRAGIRCRLFEIGLITKLVISSRRTIDGEGGAAPFRHTLGKLSQ